MKHLITLALGAALIAAPALAETQAEKIHETKQDVRASEGAVAKDNAVIADQQENVDVNRAEKEDAKAKGDIVGQASNSVQIGANKAVINAKEAEKGIDKKILADDKRQLEADKRGE